MRRLHRRLQLSFLFFLLVIGLAGMGVVAIAGRGRVGYPVLWVFAVFVLAGALTAPLARRLSRPIEALTEAVRRFGAGELSYRVPLPRCSPMKQRWRERVEARYRDRHGGRWHGRHHHFHHDEVEELLRAWNEMAARIEGLLRGQKELLANVSHELRSPLARMRVALELLPRDAESEARLRDVEADIAELDALIEAVLTTTRLEAAGLPSSPTELPLQPLARELCERAAQDPLTSGLEVRADIPDGLRAVADAALLRRALWNLIENAAKYGAAPITVGAARSGDVVRVWVADRGAGVPEAERTRVLEPFYRADKARTPGKSGFGLGLTLARRIAEAHGGDITVGAGADGTGCQVTLTLPDAGFTRASR
ncbi:MAG: HAMP domain-containing histidine kinase [Deltaproteobacteria bacterium]|nr:HAMP domain-containing histidine kinase [Deltaproteobacteria bacterium]